MVLIVIEVLISCTAMNTIHSTIKNSANLGPSLNWGYNDFYCLKQKDTELYSAHAYNGLDPFSPIIDFGKYFNGESLDQQDLVM